jgi:hypothetical protein
MIRWMIFIVVIGIADYYAFQSLRTLTRSNFWYFFYWIFTIAVIGNFIYQFYGFNRSNGFSHNNSYAIGLLIAMAVPKLIVVIALFGEDIFRVPQATYSYFTQNSNLEGDHFPQRRAFVSQIALGLAAIPFASI